MTEEEWLEGIDAAIAEFAKVLIQQLGEDPKRWEGAVWGFTTLRWIAAEAVNLESFEPGTEEAETQIVAISTYWATLMGMVETHPIGEAAARKIMSELRQGTSHERP